MGAHIVTPVPAVVTNSHRAGARRPAPDPTEGTTQAGQGATTRRPRALADQRPDIIRATVNEIMGAEVAGVYENKHLDIFRADHLAGHRGPITSIVHDDIRDFSLILNPPHG